MSDLEVTSSIPVERKKLRTRWTPDATQDIEYYEYLMEMERKVAAGEIDPNICSWTGKPHDFNVQ